MIAYTFANGVIHFGQRVPKGALPIATAPAKLLREKIGVLARWSYPTKRGGNDSVPLVPGIPEAKDQNEALKALLWFRKDLDMRLSRTGLKRI